MRNAEHLKFSDGIELDSCIREVDFLLDLPYRIWFNSSWPRYEKNGAISYAKENQIRNNSKHDIQRILPYAPDPKAPHPFCPRYAAALLESDPEHCGLLVLGSF